MATVRLWRDDEVGKDPAVKAVFDDCDPREHDSHVPVADQAAIRFQASSAAIL
jgi:hypothetical protein